MKKFWLYILSIMACLTSCITDVENVTDSGDLVKIGDKLPSFVIQTSEGEEITNHSLEGKPAVIVFFSTECNDCKRELPIVQRVFDDNKTTANFLCISRGQTEDAVSVFWAEESLSLPYSAQSDRKVYHLFATHTIPRIYITDSKGVVRKIFVEKIGEKTLRQAIETLN